MMCVESRNCSLRNRISVLLAGSDQACHRAKSALCSSQGMKDSTHPWVTEVARDFFFQWLAYWYFFERLLLNNKP